MNPSTLSPDAATRARPAPSRGFSEKWSRLPGSGSLWSASAILAALVVWQLGSGVLFNAYYLSNPFDIGRQILAWALDGYLWHHLAATLLNTVTGFVLAALFGIGAALLLGSLPLLDRILAPFIYGLYALPKIVLAPLLLLWFGVGSVPVVFMAFVTGFFMVFFNVYSGVRQTSQALLNAASLMGAGPWTLAVKVRLPAARPYVALGLQQGLVYAFHGAIVGEMTSSTSGLGYALVYAASDMDANGVLALLAVLGAITVVLLRAVERALSAPAGSRT